MDKKTYKVIGLMSGTSMDGLDIAFCEFVRDSKWRFKIIKAETHPYDVVWEERLKSAEKLSTLDFLILDRQYGEYLGSIVKSFCEKYEVTPNFISSHGHTIFHQTNKKLTFQVGHGASIYASSGIPSIADFRTLDVALGGQGAPLVPVGDKLLFPEMDFCLNLGGISNISYDLNGERIAYDIGTCNIVLNCLANKLGLSYDDGGKCAMKGKLDPDLLQKLNSLQFFAAPSPKSLGKEWVDQYIFPLIEQSSADVFDKLHTMTHHSAFQIGKEVHRVDRLLKKSHYDLLITGGGAFNHFLIDLIKNYSPHNVDMVIPDEQIIKFKEAVVFAFLGVLKLRNEANCLKTVTGASEDNSGGVLFGQTKYD